MEVPSTLSGGPLGFAVIVALYSIICLLLSGLLCYLLWKHDSRTTYVFFVSLFSGLSTAASVIQQFHFMNNYGSIKTAEYATRLDPTKMSEVILNGGARGLDQGLFWIQFYGYNVNAFMVLFWAMQLLNGTWNLRIATSGAWTQYIARSSKAFAIIFPMLLLGIANTPSILADPLTFLILCNLSLAISLIAGSGILALTLFKFVQARRKLNSLSGSGLGSRSHTATTITAKQNRSTHGQAADALEAAEARRRRDDRWMVIRFTIAFAILGVFELCIILFQYLSYTSYASTDDAVMDVSSGAQTMAIAQFMPGVTASLVAFLLWGTTSTFRAEIAALLCCTRKGHRGSRLVDGVTGVKPDYFERLPASGQEQNGIRVQTELTVMSQKGKELRVREWETDSVSISEGEADFKVHSTDVHFVTSATGVV